MYNDKSVDQLLKELSKEMQAKPRSLKSEKQKATPEDLLNQLSKEMKPQKANQAHEEHIITSAFVMPNLRNVGKIEAPSLRSEDDLLAEVKKEFPPDPRITYLNKYKDYLLDSDYEHLIKMVNTFDLSMDELTEELIRYGVEP